MSQSTSTNAYKKDWVHKLAGAYQTHDMLAYTTPAHLHAEAHPTAAHKSVGNMNATRNAHASSFTVPKSSSNPTSNPRNYAESVSSVSTANTEKPLLKEKKIGSLRKFFS